MSRCISSGSRLKLHNERDQVFLQPLPRGTCIAWHTCPADRAYIALNRLRSAAQELQHANSERFVSTLVECLRLTAIGVIAGGCGRDTLQITRGPTGYGSVAA